MSDTENSTEKPHEPTPSKLETLRRKGEVARSQEVNGLAVFGGFLLAGLAFGGNVLDQGANVLRGFFLLIEPQRDVSAGQIWQATFTAFMWPMTLFLVPVVLVVIGVIAQRAFVFAPDKLAPKISRISILKNAQSKFGPAGLFEFVKSFSKLVIFAGVLGQMIWVRRDRLLQSLHSEPSILMAEMLRTVVAFLAITVVISAAITVLDLLWQRHSFLTKNRMSRKELMDEMKQTEGDPQQKSERRRKAQEISQNRMMSEIATADVVVVNPTHFAVALAWDRTKSGSTPVCVAKGCDEVAATIRKKAIEARVPIYSDPPTARSLHAKVALGEEIRLEHFEAVAAAIRFADRLQSMGDNT